MAWPINGIGISVYMYIYIMNECMNIGLNPGPRARTVKLGPRHLRTSPQPRKGTRFRRGQDTQTDRHKLHAVCKCLMG